METRDKHTHAKCDAVSLGVSAAHGHNYQPQRIVPYQHHLVLFHNLLPPQLRPLIEALHKSLSVVSQWSQEQLIVLVLVLPALYWVASDAVSSVKCSRVYDVVTVLWKHTDMKAWQQLPVAADVCNTTSFTALRWQFISHENKTEEIF